MDTPVAHWKSGLLMPKCIYSYRQVVGSIPARSTPLTLILGGFQIF